MERQVLAIRDEHPTWGGRKIQARMLALGCEPIPAASTITAILKRHQRITPEQSQPYQRFERDCPNDLWQMDFKGEFRMTNRNDCSPLTVLDDHSRSVVGLAACGRQTCETVQQQLTGIFRRYGLPRSISTDNGNPWGR